MSSQDILSRILVTEHEMTRVCLFAAILTSYGRATGWKFHYHLATGRLKSRKKRLEPATWIERATSFCPFMAARPTALRVALQFGGILDLHSRISPPTVRSDWFIVDSALLYTYTRNSLVLPS